MSEYLVIELPPPPRPLLPNRSKGRHWGTNNGNRVLALKTAHNALLGALEQPGEAPRWKGAVGIVHIWVHAARRPDRDNAVAWLKYTQDAFAAALGFNDSHFRWSQVEVRYCSSPFTENMVVILRESGE